jgi:transcriptional regulator with XRE-family HTH domain
VAKRRAPPRGEILEIAERVREALRMRDLTQNDLIERTGLQQLSRMMTGKYGTLPLYVEPIAKALDVPEIWLRYGRGDKTAGYQELLAGELSVSLARDNLDEAAIVEEIWGRELVAIVRRKAEELDVKIEAYDVLHWRRQLVKEAVRQAHDRSAQLAELGREKTPESESSKDPKSKRATGTHG